MKAEDIKRVACVGGGTIGCSWTVNFIAKGCSVSLYDISEEKLDYAKTFIKKSLDYFVAKEVMTQAEADAAIARVTYTTDLKTAVTGVDYVQENAPDNPALKQQLLAEIEEIIPDDVIFASSTSGIPITMIAANAKHPERCLIAHPFNPPHLIPLVEIVKGSGTSDETAQTAIAFFKLLGKEPILLNKEIAGFVSNRLALALFREAAHLIEEGICSVEDADKAIVYGPGLRWAIIGPSMVYHLGGGPGGIALFTKAMAQTVKMVFSNLSKADDLPEGFGDVAQAGIMEAIEHQKDVIGANYEEISAYRDEMLFELLKLHDKI